MSNHYYGGSTVHGGKVRRLNASNFRELVERYIFIPVAFPLSRKEFFALPDPEKNSRKDGGFITSCSFKFEGEGHRADENAELIHTAILDLDSGGKEFAQAPETIGEHLYPYSFVAWTTAKHTAEHPRLKIAVDISPCDPSSLRTIIRYIAERLGLPKDYDGIKESRVISQPQYRPIQFRGEEPHAVIASRLDGIALSVLDIPVTEEWDEDDRIFAAPREDGDDIGLGLAYLPVPDLSLDRVEEALSHIDPDCGYRTWYEVSAALRHQFTEEQTARDAYEVFDRWSAKGAKYRGEEDTYAKWKSFRPYAKGRRPITIRTLFKHAMDSGWDNTAMAAEIQQDVTAWMDACTSPTGIMHEGASRIASMPFRNEVVEEALVIAWRKKIADLTGNTIDKVILRREIAKVRKKEHEAKHDQHKENLPSWLQTQCYVATEDIFYNIASGVSLRPVAFDRYFEKELIPKEDKPVNGKAIIQPSAYALNLMDIPRVDGTIYCPLHQGDDPYFELNGRRFLNTFDKIHVPVEDPEYSERAGELIVRHLSLMIEEKWIVDVLLDFLACLVQKPGHKIPWLPCIQSAEGTGKGFLAKIMAACLGQGNVKIVSPEIVRSQWNDWMTGAQFFVLEEIHFPGERREAVMNTLKPFISDQMIPVNQRNTSARNEPNWGNAIAFTNFPDALHLKEWDRRWMFIRSGLQTAEQVAVVNNSGHFEKMEWLLEDVGAGGLRYWLRKRVISSDFPFNGPAPQTKYRKAVVEESKNNMQITVEDIIADNEEPLVCEEVIHVGRLTEILYRGASDKNVNRVVHYLTVMGYERWGDGKRIMLDGSRGAIWLHKQKWTGKDPVGHLKRRIAVLQDEFEI